MNPLKLSDYFIPISNFFKRVTKISWRNLKYQYNKQIYLEKKNIQYSYINNSSWLKIDYDFENLVYLKFENSYYFNQSCSIIINLCNFNKEEVILKFKGVKDEFIYIINLQDFILTNFTDFSVNLEKNEVKISTRISSIKHFPKSYKFHFNGFKIKNSQYKIKPINYNKSNYVR